MNIAESKRLLQLLLELGGLHPNGFVALLQKKTA
jgi:hypothetical protein